MYIECFQGEDDTQNTQGKTDNNSKDKKLESEPFVRLERLTLDENSVGTKVQGQTFRKRHFILTVSILAKTSQSPDFFK